MAEPHDTELLNLMRAIAADDGAAAKLQLKKRPQLAKASMEKGASRQAAKQFYLKEIGFYVYAGATALHVAAAAYRETLLSRLLDMGADARARDRRGAEPIHAAAMGQPGSSWWNPRAQAAVITRLVAAGADADSEDKNGATPLHRAVRTRSAAAVKALLDAGADPHAKNNNGSTAAELAARTTGRGGSGSRQAKEQQREILRLLEGANPHA
jgi:ankyrin repeat protein